MKRTSNNGPKKSSPDSIRLSVSKKVIFEIRVSDIDKSPSNKYTIGDTIVKLITLAKSDLPYVRTDLLRKIPALLTNFHDFRFSHSVFVRGIMKEREVEVKAALLSDLDYCLMKWVLSFMALEDHLLLPTYALACAKFISSHIHGRVNWHDENWWQIEGMLDSTYKDFPFYHDTQFKKRVTKHIGHTIALAKVPEGSVIILGQSNKRIESGDEFLFKIQRSHLSSGLFDYSFFTIDQPKTEFDLFDDLRFRGAILFKPSKRTMYLPEECDYEELSGEIPVTWISYIRKNFIDQENQEALPDWISIS